MTDETVRMRYGLWVVVIGLLIVLAVVGLALLKFSTANDITAVVGSVTSVIGTIVGAFFGIHVGAAGKDKAEDRANKAEDKASKAANKALQLATELAGTMPPEDYKSLQASRPDLFKET
jgi:uncharacterized protein YacL